MAAKARITADFATPSEVASRLGIPAARTAELRRQIFELKADVPIPFVALKAPREELSRKTATIYRSARAKKK
jgi:hypothetical protein